MIPDDDDPGEAFGLPPGDNHPADIAARLLAHDEHRHLKDNEVSIGWLMRCDEKIKGGRLELGSVHDTKTMFQGGFRDLGLQLLAGMLGELPQFVIVLDKAWWTQAGARDREALVWHELAHIKQGLDRYGAPRFDREGNPVWEIRGHDVEAFNSELARYGAWKGDIAQFLATARTNDRI